MKRSTKYKLVSFAFLGSVLIGFNQCVMNKNKSSNLKFNDTSSSAVTSSATNEASFNQFKTTVWPITKARCAGCHATSQTPLHASSDATTAFNAVMNANKVDLTTPTNSRLYLKLLNESHNCWGTCSSNAAEILAAIETWKKGIGSTSTSTSSMAGINTPSTSTIYDALNPTSMTDEGTVTLMMESSSIKAPMAYAMGTDSIGYVWVPTTTTVKNLSSTDAGTATLNFNVVDSDFYRVYMYVNAPADASDSVYVKVAGSDYKDWFIGTTTGYEWRELTNTSAKLDTEFYISAGSNYKLEIRQKESGLKISKVVITNDLAYDPTSSVSTKLTKATLSVPISSLIGVENSYFEIDVEEFDTYSYKVSNPRIRSSKPVYVKNLKVLVNGTYTTQHSTYTIVDKTVSSADPVLSTASMIMLKDKSINEDTFSFNFQTLKAVQ